ncbi:MAG: flagellar filament capping protein FliD [Actinobacteria bacterium]|nr:flagellar filament capping protein FliD [Actinomycetota bacterium]
MVTSVDGLVSGLDSAGLISQLMDLERQPQLRLKARQASNQKVIDAFQTLNSKFLAIETAAGALNGASGWGLMKAGSSAPDKVAATASSGATSGSLSFNVTNLAAAHSVVSSTGVASLSTVVATGDFTIGSTTITAAEFGDGSLSSVVSAINASAAGVSAAAVQVSAGSYKLQLTAKATGDASAFTVDATNLTALGNFAGIVTQGIDALVQVGSGPGAYSVTSASNTLTTLLSGVTLTLKGQGAATVSVDADVDGTADKVGALVSAVNSAITSIKSQSGYDAATKTAGIFLSNQLARGLQQTLTNAVTSSVSASSLMSGGYAGISIGKDGLFAFDKTKFTTALVKDPTAVKGLFLANTGITSDDGIAERLRLVAKSATTFGTGQIALAIEGRKSENKQLESQITNWDSRLAQKEKAFKRQYGNLETMLGRLRNQGSWLAGQLGSLGNTQ